MKNSREILTSVLKTTQMGQIGIRSVLDTSMRPGLRKALESQLREYDSIETEAHSIATQRGWDMDELDPSVRVWSNLMTRMKLGGQEHRLQNCRHDDSGQHQGHDQGSENPPSVRSTGRADQHTEPEAAGLRDRQYPSDAGIFVTKTCRPHSDAGGRFFLPFQPSLYFPIGCDIMLETVFFKNM